MARPLRCLAAMRGPTPFALYLLATASLAPVDAIAQEPPVEEGATPPALPAGARPETSTDHGATHFAMGVVGVFAPVDRVFFVTPGVNFDVHHESADGKWQFGGSLRLGYQSSSSSGTSLGFFVLSFGGRLLSEMSPEASPYLGVGLALEGYAVQFLGPNFAFSGTQFGPGAYVDGGLELFHRNHTHFALGARLDLPFFTIGNQEFPASSTVGRFYYAPLSLEGRITF